MEWKMLSESKKLFPHWLDKSKDSNFSKHLSILENQQRDMRHKIKTVDWSRLLNKPLQIHKTQTEPHKWEMEFLINVPRLKTVKIYKNPTIVNNQVVNSYIVINGYYVDGDFYENHNTQITNLGSSASDGTYIESEIRVSDDYDNKIIGEEGKYYHDMGTDKYYKYENSIFSEVDEIYVPKTSEIHSASFIDNYSHFYKHIIFEDNSNSTTIMKLVHDSDGNQKYKTVFDYSENGDTENNGKYELHIVEKQNNPVLYYNISDEKYYNLIDGEFEEADENNINIILDAEDNITSPIPLIETEDITPIISDDKYVIEVYTWNDYHFLKGFPEIDFIDYNHNNIIDEDERTYDNLQIEIEKINDIEYLTFRVHQHNIKLIEVLENEVPIHIADFMIENYDEDEEKFVERKNTYFTHIYNKDNNIPSNFIKDTSNIQQANLQDDEYVYRLPITEDDKIYDENNNYELKNNYDLKVTYYDSLHPYDSYYDKILTKRYVCEDSIFYHDISLDMLGTFYNVPRHVFLQTPPYETYDEKIEYYSNTYPTFCNTLTEDDYHYQKRLEYYINNYNKIYFPVLELWKYFHIDSDLINRKVILAEQNYSYLRTLDPEENKYINELSKNKLESFYLNYDYDFEEEINLQKPKLKSTITSEDYLHSVNGILVDENNNYIKDSNGVLVRTEYDYDCIENDSGTKEYIIHYENASKKIQWYNSKENQTIQQIKLTDGINVVPNTKYRFRFCVKEYPNKDLNLRIVYKSNEGNIREVEETTPERKDYDELVDEYNELRYSDYEKEWGVECEYICTDILTLPNAQKIEIYLESEDSFKISDISLQRITINHYDSEYMTTPTDYNSCVYDLYADYNAIPSNIKYENLTAFNKVLNRSLPLSKIGYFNFMIGDGIGENMKITDNIEIYVDDLMNVESGIIDAPNHMEINTINSNTNFYEHTYRFNRYVKKGDYEIIIKPYITNEDDLLSDFNIDITMLVFTENNTSKYETITINNFTNIENNEENSYFRIPFENKSDNSLEIRLYRNDAFKFKDFKLIRKSPLTMEELK